jgi:pyruvate/2-oxoglutarate dehydrogenase complex dihydrolipoamide dehydrogenase (E3) component
VIVIDDGRPARTIDHRLDAEAVLTDPHGIVKVLTAPQTGQIPGAQIVGTEAGELIHELIAVMYHHGTAADLLRVPHCYPMPGGIVTYPAESIVDQMRSR